MSRSPRSRPIAAALLLAAVLVTPAAAAAPSAAAAPPADKPAASLVPADPAALKKAVETAGGKAVLVNIWATWCVPCREEFPDVLKVRRDLAGQGLKVILVSADFDDTRDDAVQFLRQREVDFSSYIKVGRDEDFIAALAPKWSGVLPATLIFDGHGRLAHLLEGKQTYETFRKLVVQVIDTGRNTQ